MAYVPSHTRWTFAWSGGDRPAVGGELDVDVAVRGVRVRADVVRGLDQRDRLLGVLDRRQRHVELDGEHEPAVVGRDEADLRVDGDVAGLDPLAAGDGPQGALEARRVADGEQLLGVGAAAFAARLGRRAQLDLEQAVAGAAVPVGATAGDVRAGRVQGLSRHLWRLPSGARHRPSVEATGSLRKRCRAASFTPSCDASSRRPWGAVICTSVL